MNDSIWYLHAVEKSWELQAGHALSELVSLKGNHINETKLYSSQYISMIENQLDQPMEEIVSSHLRVLRSLFNKDYNEAYKNQSICAQAVVKMLQFLKDENFCLPIMYKVCSDLRLLAQKCEEQGCGSKPGELLEKAAESLMACFRVCAADNRSTDEETKRHGMLNLVNQLFKVYFRINKLHLCKPLIRAIESSAFRDSFPLPELVTYKYFVGRKAMFDSDYKAADEYLSFAFEKCNNNYTKNKRLILIYLVPVKILLGYLPSKEVLEKYDVLQFYELSCALKEGNILRFDQVIQRHEDFFIKNGIYLIVEKLKIIAYRNLFKKVYLIQQTHQLDLDNFLIALKYVGEDDMTIDETQCILANLIYEGKIKGYISHQHNKLVVSKQIPFPPLNSAG